MKHIFTVFIISFAMILLISGCKSKQEEIEDSIEPAVIPALRDLNEFEFIYYEYKGKDTANPINRNIAGLRIYKVNDQTSMLEITFNDLEQTSIIFRGTNKVGKTYISTFSKYQRQIENGVSQDIVSARKSSLTFPAFFGNNSKIRAQAGTLKISFGKAGDTSLVGFITPFSIDYIGKKSDADDGNKVFQSFYLDADGMQQLLSAIDKANEKENATIQKASSPESDTALGTQSN